MGSIYNEMWNESRDELLLRMLDHYSCYNNKRIGIDDVRQFNEIITWPGELKRYGITAKDVQERFPMLYTRYITWKFIIEFDGVYYDALKNTVEAGDHVWDAICKENNFAAVYRRSGHEMMWNELIGVFGPDSIRTTRNAMFSPVNTSHFPPSIDYTIQYSSSEEEVEYVSPEVASRDHQNTQERTLVWTLSPIPPNINPVRQDSHHEFKGSGSSRTKKGATMKSKRKLQM